MWIEPVFRDPPFRFAHAACLAETRAGPLCVWFAGLYESHPSTAIWSARREGGAWRAPRVIADPPGEAAWNPVLHVQPGGEILLFYRSGEDPTCWRSWLRRSRDDGDSWSAPEPLPEGCLGPIRSRPAALPDGALLCPASTEAFLRGETVWRAHLERFDPATGAGTRGPDLEDPDALGAIQPSLTLWPDGRAQLFCRSRAGVVAIAWSDDGGGAWGPLVPSSLPNPNSAVDVARLADGRLALALNPSDSRRAPLILAFSDDGLRWRRGPTLADGPGAYAYPTLLARPDGGLTACWSDHRQGIMAAALTPEDLAED